LPPFFSSGKSSLGLTAMDMVRGGGSGFGVKPPAAPEMMSSTTSAAWITVASAAAAPI
jgi:hypothetical protein